MIKKASRNNISDIFRIYSSYLLDSDRISDQKYLALVENSGFFISLSDKKDFIRRIKKSTFFNVHIIRKKVVGFIDINKEIYFPEEAPNIHWKNESLKKIYFHDDDKSISLHYIAVDLKYKNHGVARQLMEDSEVQLAKLGYKYLFSIVPTEPIRNIPSINWHKKMGFKIACISSSINIFGIKNCTSTLYYKTLI